ncbi:cupin domain-containing protein [Alkaliphilus hydrothermalis]|uniref:Mannose-6-phosphate isomerase-like protein (Cupin superfamily) n=1 Tax=Alkaliphilus hydrothermalis TaxID=1482730 RepID=A0ABS2NQ84_9FIRM|nr:cupin domain-containing protein [Alkaliphilus hydrothermalis]MBM7615108.1 mannose-6-phosphate isomerase-like protein (cupin superfamily) [Alkaliphilus hydrothermalis]
MYHGNNPYRCPYHGNTPNNDYNVYNYYRQYPCWVYPPMYNHNYGSQPIHLKDYGPCPYVVNIEEASKQNDNFRLALWTGGHLQVTLMSIPVGESIGLEVHPKLDQFIRIEEGQGLAQMGNCKDQLDFQAEVYDDYAIIIPAGKWHNLTNTGCKPLKLYSIYAPPEHPFGTIHRTKEDAEREEGHHEH